VKIGRIADAIEDLRWACKRYDEIGYPKDDQGSIQNSLGYALLWHGDLEESIYWLEAGKKGIGRSYGLRSPPYAKQLFDLSLQMMWQALMRSDDMRLCEAEMETPLQMARESLDISVKADKARRYAFEGGLGLCACLVNIGAYEEAATHVDHAKSLLEEIANQESSRSALARRPRLLRAEAAVLAALNEDEQARKDIDELRQLRSRYPTGSPGEDARGDCVIAQVQFAIGDLSSTEVRDTLQRVAQQMTTVFGGRNPIALLAQKLAARYTHPRVADRYRRLPVIL
jgi:hypothetical protein